MTGFTPEWLALREPADARARDADLTTQLVQRARQRSPARFIDLACGAGANVRYLAPLVGGNQKWLLVDNDAVLLERAEGALLEAVAQPNVRQIDLATELAALDFASDVIVTASALLDLVSDRWLTQLVEQCCANRCTALFALSYDGRIALTPSDPDDEWVRQLVNRHQLGDKGFGPALGPEASRRAGELFRAAGYQVRTARSDWHLLPSEQLLQQSLLEGWAGAVNELAPHEADRCSRWLERRMAYVGNAGSRITVGHEDFLAWPDD